MKIVALELLAGDVIGNPGEVRRITFTVHPDDAALVKIQRGRRYAGLFFEITDDESLAEPGTKPGAVTRRASNEAAILCKRSDFNDWAREMMGGWGAHLKIEDVGREYILRMCDIDSRADLDANDVAAKVFYGLVARFERYLALAT